MNIRKAFEEGVTPKSGEYAGKRFRVERITKEGFVLQDWDTGKPELTLSEDACEIWTPPKGLFESDAAVTWGALKHAIEEKGLSDDTEIYVDGTPGFPFFGSFSRAFARLAKVDGKTVVVFW